MTTIMSKKEVIEKIENQEITPDGANFYLLLLILEELEKISNIINKNNEVKNA